MEGRSYRVWWQIGYRGERGEEFPGYWVIGDNGDVPEDGGLRSRFMEEAEELISEHELEMTVGF